MRLATLLFAPALALAAAAPARAEIEHSVLFEDTYLDTGYSSAGARFGHVGAHEAALASAAGGWHFDPRWTFGVRGDVLTGSIPVQTTGGGANSSLGLFILSGFGEAKLADEGFFAVLAAGSVGWGQAGYRDGSNLWQSTSLTAIEPDVTGLFHLSHRLDVELSLGYRDVLGAQLTGLNASDLKGATASIMLRGNF